MRLHKEGKRRTGSARKHLARYDRPLCWRDLRRHARVAALSFVGHAAALVGIVWLGLGSAKTAPVILLSTGEAGFHLQASLASPTQPTYSSAFEPKPVDERMLAEFPEEAFPEVSISIELPETEVPPPPVEEEQPHASAESLYAARPRETAFRIHVPKRALSPTPAETPAPRESAPADRPDPRPDPPHHPHPDAEADAPPQPSPSPSAEARKGASRQADIVNVPSPVYPWASRRYQEEGVVGVEVTVSPEGTAERAILAEPSPYARLNASALEAASMASFVPALRHGEPVRATVLLRFRFQLR